MAYTDINSEDRLVQAPFAEHLAKVLRWESVYAWNDETFWPDGTLGRTDTCEAVLTRDLRAAIARLKPELPTAAVAEAVATLARTDFTRSLLQHNQECYRFIRDGVPVSYRDASGQLRDTRARVIDFQNGRGADGKPNNRFVAVRELKITGLRAPSYNRRADLVCFVNGLPLVFIELKAVYKNIRAGFDGNLRDYLDENAAIEAREEAESVRLLELVESAHPDLGKLGVFWHTQGSGKSYSMAFFAEKVRRQISAGFTFLLMTDRDDLDDQIYGTFVGCGVADENIPRAGSGDELKRILQENHRYVFSLIHKFNQDVSPREPYSTRDDIIVVSDEAHRTQAGKLARNMRLALPRAAFIGFTGTPLFKHDNLTKRIFGGYVSRYDFKRSEEDGATAKLIYENRGGNWASPGWT